jgi:hypothetical protein
MILTGLWLLGSTFLGWRHDPYWMVISWAVVGAVVYTWSIRWLLLQVFVARADRLPTWVVFLGAVLLTIMAEYAVLDSAVYFAVAATI